VVHLWGSTILHHRSGHFSGDPVDSAFTQAISILNDPLFLSLRMNPRGVQGSASQTFLGNIAPTISLIGRIVKSA